MQPHFSKGSSHAYAFVFSCPGKQEEDAMHPAAGKTGRNLEALLQLLSARLGRTTLTRGCITITNAWPQVEHQERSGRSEATGIEIRNRSNIDRLANELRHITEMIVFCGGKAEVALHELVKLKLIIHPTKIAVVEHIGARGLLSIRRDIQGKLIVAAEEQRRLGRKLALKRIQAENTHRRLEVVAQRLLDSVKGLS
jgi:hypothetical protein